MLCWAQTLTPFSLTCQVGLMVEFWPEVAGSTRKRGAFFIFMNFFCQIPFGKKKKNQENVYRVRAYAIVIRLTAALMAYASNWQKTSYCGMYIIPFCGDMA